jgi:hypothetical protein
LINADKPHLWKNDVQASVRMYNEWFLQAAPEAYRTTRKAIVDEVAAAFRQTSDMSDITPEIIRVSPSIVRTLRMCTAPPIARDRLTGLSGSVRSVVPSLEKGALPPRVKDLSGQLTRICGVITELLDLDLFDWLKTGSRPDAPQWELATVVVGDRLCGAISDPIVRNAQERRQLALLAEWLDARGYVRKPHPSAQPLRDMQAGTYSFRQVVLLHNPEGRVVQMPIDAVVQPHDLTPSGLPILIEAKSAGDFTNTNKRRKEEAQKVHQLREEYGTECSLLLFLCGYFDPGYLGYEASEGLDWIWEHRIDDLTLAGI